MRARYAYPLLFLMPAAMIACVAALLAVAAGAGILWIFVYGDDPWPRSASTALMAAAVVPSGATLAALTVLSHRFGKSREGRGGLARSHALAALVVSVLLPLLAVIHQWQAGNLENGPVPPADSATQTAPRGAR